MNFSVFLKERRTIKKIATAKDHYETLGGEKTLGFSLRHFQLIESGKHPPSERLLATLFRKTKASDRRALVLAYFRSILDENADSDLIEYLEQHLTPAMETEKKSIWETTKRFMTYSEDQLDYLTQNQEVMRFHKRILLLDSSTKTDCSLSKDKLREMQALDLIEITEKEIRPSRNLYRLPHYDNSSPRAVAKATEYIQKHIDLYISKEGSPRQELSYAVQMVPQNVADRVLDQMKAFKRWVQSLASSETGPNVVPIVFVGFTKQIERKEL